MMEYKKDLGELNSLLIRINKERKRIMQRSLDPLGLTLSQIATLKAANDHPGSIQKELSFETGIAPTVLVGILTNMENMGLLWRQTCPDNRRIFRIYVTDQGKQYIDQIEEITDKVMIQVLDGFSDEEIAELHTYLQRFHANCVSIARQSE